MSNKSARAMVGSSKSVRRHVLLQEPASVMTLPKTDVKIFVKISLDSVEKNKKTTLATNADVNKYSTATAPT